MVLYFLILFCSFQVVVNALFAAIPGIGNVVLVSVLFWLMFSILGVHFFAGLSYKCVDTNGERISADVVSNKAECLTHRNESVRWVNSKVNFDNVLNGFLALFQVVSKLRGLSISCGYEQTGHQMMMMMIIIIIIIIIIVMVMVAMMIMIVMMVMMMMIVMMMMMMVMMMMMMMMMMTVMMMMIMIMMMMMIIIIIIIIIIEVINRLFRSV